MSATSDTNKTLGERFLGTAERAVYLIRPDQHIVARWSEYDAARVRMAVATALGKHNEHPNPDPKYPNGDDFYEKLLNAHEGLSKEQSDALNARLILVLSNHIGDMDILEQALKAAKTAGQAS